MARVVQGLRPPPGNERQRVARPIKLARGTQRPTGPKMFRPGTKPQIITGPNQPPAGFLNGNNSRSEWMIFWALTKLLGPEGEGNWLYQGKIGRGLPGGSKPDFVVYQLVPMAIRIQTERYHVAVSERKHAYDDEQRVQLERQGYRVYDIYEQDYINDPMGVAALRVTQEVLENRQRPNPVRMRTAMARG